MFAFHYRTHSFTSPARTHTIHSHSVSQSFISIELRLTRPKKITKIQNINIIIIPCAILDGQPMSIFNGVEMSQMREITTIIRNPNSDTAEKLNNGMRPDGVPQATIKQYSRTNSGGGGGGGSATVTKSDRNNNNVMNKSMPPPIPPKKPLKNGTSKTNSNNIIAAMYDNNNKASAVSATTTVVAAEAAAATTTTTTKANGNGTSHTDAINHCHGPNATPTTPAVSNVLHKLSNPSNDADKNSDGKGHHGRLNGRLDVSDVGAAVVAQMNCIGDRKTASGCATTQSDNHKKLNDNAAAAAVVTLTIATKCGSPNSGTSYHCDNGMTIITHTI